MANPEKKRQIRTMLEDQLKEMQASGQVVFWTNFTSAWQKLCAGTGRAKKLGRGFLETLDGLSSREALDVFQKKAFGIFGVALIGNSDYEGGEGTDTDVADEPRWASPLGHAAVEESASGTAWASPLGHAASRNAKAKGKGPSHDVSDPWASFLPKGWGAPKGKGKTEAARAAAPLASKGKSFSAGGGKGSKPTPWTRRLRPTAGEGKGSYVVQPQWEKGSLLNEEWNVEVIAQEELLERDGVALVSRQFLLENADVLVTNGGPSAAIIPEGLDWFEDKPRSEVLAGLLNEAQEISFNYSFTENGIARTRPKDGHLIQLAWQDVIQRTGPLRSFSAEKLDEITLEFYKDAMPLRKWEEVSRDPKQFIEKVVMDIVEDHTLMLRTSRVKDKGGSKLATVKVPTDLTCTILTNVDRHHLFARMTVRDDGKDSQNEPIWVPSSGDKHFLAHIRELREAGLRNAGGAYRGICMRYLRDNAGLQAGVRVVADDAPAVRRKILPATLQPAEEVRHVVGKQYYRVFGMPLNMSMRSVSAQLFREIGWAVLPVREIVRPTSRTSTWVVTADEAPSELRFYARFGGARSVNVVNIEAEEGKTRGRSFAPNKGTNPQALGPRYFNPYVMEYGDNDVGMADESGAETVQYDDEEPGGQSREGIFESAQESSDGAWGLVSRASRRKGKGKSGQPQPKAAAAQGEKGGSERMDAVQAPPPPATAPRVQRYNLAGEDAASSRQGADVLDLIKALREDARLREEEAARRHQEQREWMKRLETTDEAHTTNLAQLNMQTAALNFMMDDLNNRLKAIERSSGAGVVAAVTPVVHRAEAADVAVPTEDAEMAETPRRGRKGMRDDSPVEDEEDGRPRPKRHALEDFESAAEVEEASQL